MSAIRLGISTIALGTETPAAIERAAALGFDTVELNLQPHEFGYDYRRKPGARFYRELRARLDALGLTVWSTTAVPLTQPQMFSERARREILLGAAVAAGMVGSHVFVVDPADIFGSEMAFNRYLTDGTAPPVIDGFDEAWVQAANRHVTVAVRNVDYWLGLPLTNQVDRLERVTRDLAIGWAMDLPLALLRNTLENWQTALGARLAVAYAYDLQDGGRPRAPRDPGWRDWLPALRQTTVKCVILRADPGQSEAELRAAAAHMREALATAGPAPAGDP